MIRQQENLRGRSAKKQTRIRAFRFNKNNAIYRI